MHSRAATMPAVMIMMVRRGISKPKMFTVKGDGGFGIFRILASMLLLASALQYPSLVA